VTGFYRASPKEEFQHANRKEYLTLQYTTFEERALETKFKEQNTELIGGLRQWFKQITKPKSRTKKASVGLGEELPEQKKRKEKKSRKQKEDKIKWIEEHIIDDGN